MKLHRRLADLLNDYQLKLCDPKNLDEFVTPEEMANYVIEEAQEHLRQQFPNQIGIDAAQSLDSE